MGAKQSQDSTTNDVPPVPAATTGSVLPPSLFSRMPVSSGSQETMYPHSELSGQRDLGVPPALPIRPFFAGQNLEEEEEEEGDSLTAGLSYGQHRDGHRRHDGRPHGSHQDRHNRHHHHRRHHANHQSGSGHGRRAHRYLVGDGDNSEPIGMEFDFSLASLNQRLRALQLRRENEESASGSSSGGGDSSSRHRHHSHSSRSHSRNQFSSSLPASSFFFLRPERKSTCPVCKKEIPSGDLDTHIVMCMTKPRVEFNEDNLRQDAGECTICLEDMFTGDAIARLPCLCVYHIKCLKLWYEKSQTCPEHPEFVS